VLCGPTSPRYESVSRAVRRFYQRLPFNYQGDLAAAAAAVRTRDAVLNYPVLVPLLQRGVRAIDVGCGTGWLVNGINCHYARYGSEAVGLDFNPEAIRQARVIASSLNQAATFIEADLFEYRPPQPYDLLISLGVLHHTNDCVAAVRHVCRHFVHAGGYALIGLYHRDGRQPFLDHFTALRAQGASDGELQTAFSLLRRVDGDRLRETSWFLDQVKHPHETQHTLGELLPVLESEGMEVMATSLNGFDRSEPIERLIHLERSYYARARQLLQDGVYCPGFFVVLACKGAAAARKGEP
jgi:SAM-dependent methyltransferase